MGKHEIRLRRQRLTAKGADRFRNFNNVMQRHEEEMRIKKIIKVFTFFAVILIVVMLIIIISRFEKRQNEKEGIKNASSKVSHLKNNQLTTLSPADPLNF